MTPTAVMAPPAPPDPWAALGAQFDDQPKPDPVPIPDARFSGGVLKAGDASIPRQWPQPAPPDPWAALGAQFDAPAPVQAPAPVAPAPPPVVQGAGPHNAVVRPPEGGEFNALDSLRRGVADSAVGHSLQTAMPGVAKALHLQPTETVGSQEYQQHAQQVVNPQPLVENMSQPEAQEWLKAAAGPLAPQLAPGTFRETPGAPAPPIQNILTGASAAAGGLSTPDNLALMALPIGEVAGITGKLGEKVLPRLLSAGFTVQMVKGLYEQAKQYKQAKASGDDATAEQLLGQMAVTAPMLFAAGAHAVLGGHGAPHTAEAENAPRGTSEPQVTDTNPVLHGTDDVEELRKSAERQAPKIGDAAAAAVDGVPGAKLEAVRDSKDTDRIEDKAERQGVKPSQIADIAAAKITVPDQASAQQVLENLDKTMHVESVNGSVEGEGQKNNVRQVQAIVQTGGEGEPVRRAEILIQTPEMAAATEGTHDDYRQAQELRASGDEAGAAKLEEKIAAEHDAAHEAAGQRLKNVQNVQNEVKTDEEPKFKFSSTQHNIAPDSDAGVALDAVRSRIKDEDLAGDGRDTGGNHVTVRYGLKGDLTPEMRSYIEGQAPFDATLGPLEAFKPSEASDGAAPIHAPVASPELSRINGEIGGHGDFEKSDFDDYKPHATVAYVKPEAAERYTGDKTTEGKKFRVDSIAVTDRNGGSTEIPLKGSGQTGVQAGLPGAITPEEKEAGVQNMPVAQIRQDPKRFQYKLNTDSSGVTNLLKGRKWNPDLAGLITAWRDPADGNVYVVNGHHRFELAKENRVPDVTVKLLDVPTAAAARAVGALQNIAEGRGTPLDAAKFFRDSGYTPEQLDVLVISMGEATASNGVALSRLDQRLFDQAVSGKLRQGRAIAIGNASADPADQEALVKLIDKAESNGKKVTDDVVDELARMVKGAGQHTETQQGLFGAQEMTKNLALEKAEVSSAIREKIGQERRAFQSVADAGKASTLGKVKGQTIKPKENAAIAEEAKQAQELYDRLSTRSGTIDEILNRSAGELASGGNGNAIKQRAYDDIRAELSKTVSGGAAGKSEGVSEGKRAAQEAPAARPAGSAPVPPAARPAAESGQLSADRGREPEPKPAVRAPAPPAAERPTPESDNLKGKQILVQDAAGKWRPGEVKADIVNGGNNGSRTLRGVYGDGSRFDAKPNQIRPYTESEGRRGQYRPLTSDGREQEIIGRTKKNLPQMVADYRNEFTKDGVVTVATDAAKSMYPEFQKDPVKNERIVHTSAGAVAESVLNSELAHPPKPGQEFVDITTASPGSGKTASQAGEGASNVGLRLEDIMDKQSDADALMDKLLKAGRKPAVTWIYVDDPVKTVQRMVYRAVGHGGREGIGRSVPIDYMSKAYTDIPRVLKGLMDKYGDQISVMGVDNSGDPGTAKPIDNLNAVLEKAVHWDREEVFNAMKAEVEKLRDKGVFKGERNEAIYENISSRGSEIAAGKPAESSPGPQGDRGKRDEVAPEAGRSEVPGPLLKEQRDNEARTESRKASIPDAQKRTLRENAASHKTEVIESGGHKAIVLDPDGEAVWHRLFKNLKNAEGENLLGAGTSWRGLVLDKQQANAAIAYLRAGAEDSSIAAVPDKAASDGYNRLADTLKGARNAQGGVTLLRGDYRADTLREEGTHHWQREHGLDKSEAMLEVAGRPEFTETAQALREMGYEDATPRTVAMEIMAKAMAGDPELTLTDDQRESLVRSFLTEAVEEKGSSILRNLPEMDPRLEKVVNEVKRGYDYDEQYDQRAQGGGRQGARVEDGSGRGGPREEDRPGEGAGRGRQRGDDDVQQVGKEKRAPETELAFQRGRAPKPPPSMMLPGFEDDVDAQRRSEEEEQARRLSETMQTPKGDISRAAGEMERNSPLFRGTGDNPLLFQKAKDEEGPVSRKVSDLAEDLWFNRPDDKRSAIERVSEWTKDTLDESLGRSQKALGRIPTAFQKAWAWTKATSAALVHDWKHPLEQTDWKHSVGDMQLAEAETAQRLQGLAKELKKSVPKETDRIAMTHYMEAGGSQAKLREWAAGSKAKAMQATNDPLMSRERKQYLQEAPQHYERALNLTPEQKELAQKFRDHFDDMLELAKQNGLLEYGYRNYVMHLYEKADAANLLHEVDTNDLNPNPGLIKRRFYDTFFSAEQNGMTAKSKDIAYLLTAYDKSMNEAIASRNFMRGLLDAKAPDGRPIAAIKMRGGWLIAKEGQEPQVMKQRQRPESLEGYRDFDRPQLRNFLFKPTTEDLAGYDPRLFDEDPDKLAFRGDLIIHPKYAGQVEDMLTPGWFERGEGAAQKTGRFIAKASGAAKELMTVAAPFHMVQEGIHSIEHKVNPFNLKDIDLSGKSEDSKKQRLLASRGLTLTNYDAEGLFATKALRGIFEAVPVINKAMDTLHSFSRWQFEDFIPKLKMQMALEAFDRNTERYDGKLSKDQIAELTAKESNAAFGNLNSMFDSVPRTKTFKAILRLALFAPDFLESRMRFVGQSFTRYGGEQRAALIRGALVQYAVARVANAILNDGDAKWDPQHAFSIVYHGKAYQLRTVQGDLLHAVIDPNGFIYNRLNPLTTRPAIEFISGRDQMGREKAFGSQVKDLAKAALPFGVQKVIQTPDEDWLNSILTSTGFEAKNDRTPTEQEVHKLYLKHIPDSNQSEEKQAESRKLRAMEDAVRHGKMAPADVWNEVQKGAITPKEAARTVSRAQKSRLALEFESLSLPDAMKVYASVQSEVNHPKAFPHAHLDLAELKPEMQRKRALVEELPQADRQATAEKLNDMLAENDQ